MDPGVRTRRCQRTARQLSAPRRRSQLPDIHARLSTADLRIDYLRPAPVDVDMVCEARVQLAGRRLIWVDAVVFPEGRRDDVVAMGRGTFAVKAAAPSGAAADGDAETSESA